MKNFPDDGPTSVFRCGVPVPEAHRYPVTCSKPPQKDALAELEGRLEAQCGLHFLHSGNEDEWNGYSAVPLTIFARSECAYFANIDEAEDKPAPFIGAIFRDDLTRCYPLVRGFGNFLRLMICCPRFLEQFHPGHAEFSLPECGVSEGALALLKDMRLTPLTDAELKEICSESNARAAIDLKRTAD